ncbi:acetylornithine deacetylase [Xylophilus sp. GW821-FHT01B05]
MHPQAPLCPAAATTPRRPGATCLDIVSRLVAFDTVSRHSNLPLVHWVRDYLDAFGIESHLGLDASGRKANLFASLGPRAPGGLVLSGHTDTVPVDGQAWQSAPFEAVERAGRLYGRGTVDMKGFIGACLAAVPRLLAADLAMPVHLALTFDEETSMLGVRQLVADLRDRGLAPQGCVIGEPTELRAVVGHKGRRHVRCQVRGRAAHSSLALDGVNAIEYAAEIVAYVRQLGDRLAQQEARHAGYAIPHTTVQTTTIAGGLSANTVPEHCSFDFEFRHLPWTDAAALEEQVRAFALQQVLPRMRSRWPDGDIRFDTESALPAFEAGPGSDAAAGVAWLLGRMRRAGRQDGEPGYVGFGTEASWFQHAGIPTLVCGPGAIEQAHKPDEFITLDQLARCEDFIDQLAGL